MIPLNKEIKPNLHIYLLANAHIRTAHLAGPVKNADCNTSMGGPSPNERPRYDTNLPENMAPVLERRRILNSPSLVQGQL